MGYEKRLEKIREIASILHVSLPKTDGVPIPAIVRDLNDYNKLILIIVDGLGLNLYEIFKHYFNFNGMVIGCKGVSMHTTPAIATILTGLYPHNHGVFETRHAYTSDPISVVELASEGYRNHDLRGPSSP